MWGSSSQNPKDSFIIIETPQQAFKVTDLDMAKSAEILVWLVAGTCGEVSDWQAQFQFRLKVGLQL